MTDEYITRHEYEEYKHRAQDEDKRLSKRITEIKEVTQQINSLTLSVQKLASNMERMLEIQQEQEDRIKEIEERDGEMWRKTTGYIMTTIVGLVVGFLFTQIGV